jgi:ribose transport system substrate-binding protein
VSGGAGSAIVTQAQAALSQNYAGTDGPVASSGPAPAPGKSVWVITCGQAALGCATLGNAAVAAAQTIGWKATLCDGKLSPPAYVQCVDSAVAAHADAIIPTIVDCPDVRAPLQKAHDAGIKIYGLVSFDCDAAGAPKLFDGTVQFKGAKDLQDFYTQLAATMADYVIAKSNGTGHILVVGEGDDYAGRAIYDAQRSAAKKCTTCKVYELKFSLSDLGTGVLASKVSAALVQHPDVTWVMSSFDAAILAGIGQAVTGAGRPLQLTGLEGLPPNVAMIKQGRQTAVAGLSLEWMGWAAIDGLNRVFAGQPQVESGIGWQTVDKDHNLPGSPAYDGNVGAGGQAKADYKAVYRKSWGK